MIRFKRILCPTDLSEESFKAFPYAFHLARVLDAEICFINVVNLNIESTSTLHTDAVRQLREALGDRAPENVDFREIVVEGSPAEQILRAVDEHEIDLIVIATHGRTGWRHMVFGSVAERVVRQSKVPVLTVSAKLAAPETEKQLVEEIAY